MKVYFLDDYSGFNSTKQLRLYVKRNNIAPDVIIHVDDLIEFLDKEFPFVKDYDYKGYLFLRDEDEIRSKLIRFMLNKELNKEVVKD